MRTVVVMPTYDEADNVATVLDRIRSAAPSVDVLVVDDNSPDGTADVVEAVGAGTGGVQVLRRPAKAGLGPAYRAGFDWALDHGYDVVVGMDADLSHDPAELPALIGAVEAGADLALGSRYVPGGAIPDWPVHRCALSRWGNRYATAVLDLPVSDVTSGYRAYRAGVLREIGVGGSRASGYGFLIEMVYRVARLGGKLVEVPIVFVDRELGTSKMSSPIIVEALVLVTLWGVRDRVVSWLHRRRAMA